MLKTSFWNVSWFGRKRTGLVLGLTMGVALAAAFGTGSTHVETVTLHEINRTEEKTAQAVQKEVLGEKDVQTAQGTGLVLKTAEAAQKEVLGEKDVQTAQGTDSALKTAQAVQTVREEVLSEKMVQEGTAAKKTMVSRKTAGLPKDEIRAKQTEQRLLAEAKQKAEKKADYGALFDTCLSTESIAKAVCEEIEEETLELMSSAAGTTSYGYIKIYAGTTPLIITEDDKEVLLRIVEAEATAEDVKGRMLVANVILNRVVSPEFPDTITDVVFQNNGSTYQFAPIKDGRYWSVKISEKTKEAVERVLKGEDYSQGALYFAARSLANPENMSWFDRKLTKLFRYGVHEFFTQ